jgi:uncharacterized protein DUF6719
LGKTINQRSGSIRILAELTAYNKRALLRLGSEHAPSLKARRPMMPLRIALFLAVVISTGSSFVAHNAPSTGNLKEGEVVYTDDGTCPHGKIDKVTGGNHKLGIGRKHVCVVHP